VSEVRVSVVNCMHARRKLICITDFIWLYIVFLSCQLCDDLALTDDLPPSEGGSAAGTTEATDSTASAACVQQAAANASDAQGVAHGDEQPTDHAGGSGDSARTTVGCARRRGSKPNQKLKDYVPKPRGAPGGPLRTPLHIGDTWQHHESYQVEKVSMCL
jgi:hypothetical protein